MAWLVSGQEAFTIHLWALVWEIPLCPHSAGACAGPRQCGTPASHSRRWSGCSRLPAPVRSAVWGSTMTVTSSWPGPEISEPCLASITASSAHSTLCCQIRLSAWCAHTVTRERRHTQRAWASPQAEGPYPGSPCPSQPAMTRLWS